MIVISPGVWDVLGTRLVLVEISAARPRSEFFCAQNPTSPSPHGKFDMRRALLPGSARGASDRALARPETVRRLDQAILECAAAEADAKRLRRELAMAESRQASSRQLKTAMARAVSHEAQRARAARARGKACQPPAYVQRLLLNAAAASDGDSQS